MASVSFSLAVILIDCVAVILISSVFTTDPLADISIPLVEFNIISNPLSVINDVAYKSLISTSP